MIDAGNAGVREPQRVVPAAARVRASRRCRACARRPQTLDVATPFVHQVRLLVSKQELRGLVADLRPTIPRLAKLTKRTIPLPRAGPGARELLQPGGHPVVERHGPGRRGLPASRRSGPSTRRPATASSGSPARAAPGTPTASTSASRARGGAEHRAARRPTPTGDPTRSASLQQQLLGQMPRIEVVGEDAVHARTSRASTRSRPTSTPAPPGGPAQRRPSAALGTPTPPEHRRRAMPPMTSTQDAARGRAARPDRQDSADEDQRAASSERPAERAARRSSG